MKPRTLRLCRTAVAIVLCLGMVEAFAQGADGPPWLSRWLEQGYNAELHHLPRRAAQRYCTAAWH